jgi:hypothetical protein
MENSERLLTVVKTKEGIFLKQDYELFITDKRMVFVLAEVTKDWSRERMNKAMLDGLLSKNKKDFEIAYEDIEKMRLLKTRTKLGDPSHYLDIYLKKGGIREFSSISDEDSKKLSAVLLGISPLKGKLEVVL